MASRSLRERMMHPSDASPGCETEIPVNEKIAAAAHRVGRVGSEAERIGRRSGPGGADRVAAAGNRADVALALLAGVVLAALG